MFVFMIVLLPVFTLLYCMKSKDAAVRIVAVSGFLTGVIVTMIKAGFSFMHRIAPYSFFLNFSYLSLTQYLLPAALVFTTYFFITKDKTDFKIKSFFPLCAAFYSVYMPYCIIASTHTFYFFTLFVKPVLLLSMLIICSDIIVCIHRRISSHSNVKAVFCSIMLAGAAVIPPCLETFWMLKFFIPAVYILSGLYALLSLILFRSNVEFWK